MINYQCFGRLAMDSNNNKAESVKMYFIKLRKFLIKHQDVNSHTLNNKKELKKYGQYESIFLKLEELKILYKDCEIIILEELKKQN